MTRLVSKPEAGKPAGIFDFNSHCQRRVVLPSDQIKQPLVWGIYFNSSRRYRRFR